MQMDGEVFGAIVGGTNEQLRRCCAQEVARRNLSGISYFSLFSILNITDLLWF